jgi:hypothetical protein
MYDGLIQRFTNKINQYLSDIDPVYNFEYGSEFEIALCYILRDILPKKYGVCRGYIVGRNANEIIGDDIIIFDPFSFPTLRFLPQNDYSLKQKIPSDSVYIYIEAKHNLTFDVASDELEQTQKKSEITIHKALSQVGKAKEMANKRPDRPLESVIEGFKFQRDYVRQAVPGYPDKCNPFYTAIITKKASLGKDPRKSLLGAIESVENVDLLPDLIIAGPDKIVLPYLPGTQGKNTLIPFRVPGTQLVTAGVSENNSLAVGLCHILWALQHIKLQPIHWGEILFSQLLNPAD